MSLTKSKKRSNKTKRKTNNVQQRLDREWQRVLHLRKRNEALEKELTEFIEECTKAIRVDEEKMAHALYEQTAHIVSFLGRKSLGKTYKYDLIDWIHENLQGLLASPFSANLDLKALVEQLNVYADPLEEIGNNLFEHEQSERDNNKNKASSRKKAFSKEQEEAAKRKEHTDRRRKESRNKDMFEDLFGDFDDSDDEYTEFDQEDFVDCGFLNKDFSEEEFFEDPFRQFFEESEREQKRKVKNLNDLLKKSSIKAVFRRLAKLLHPDREQDPVIKEKRHEQMSELIQARESNDVFTLLSLYQQYTGDSPLQTIVDDGEDVITLLKAQVQELQDEHNQIIYEDPIRGIFYDRFYAKNPVTRQKKIQTYCRELRRIVNNENETTKSVRTVTQMKTFLQERRFDQAIDSFRMEDYTF